MSRRNLEQAVVALSPPVRRNSFRLALVSFALTFFPDPGCQNV